jgi:hypothetical protein
MSRSLGRSRGPARLRPTSRSRAPTRLPGPARTRIRRSPPRVISRRQEARSLCRSASPAVFWSPWGPRFSSHVVAPDPRSSVKRARCEPVVRSMSV